MMNFFKFRLIFYSVNLIHDEIKQDSAKTVTGLLNEGALIIKS